MYPFLTLDDSTEIVHSEIHVDGTVTVYVEKPDEKDCFHSATCILPGYQWRENRGFIPEEISRYEEIILSNPEINRFFGMPIITATLER